MNVSSSSFGSESRISSKIVSAMLLVVGLALAFLSDFQPDTTEWVPIFLLALLFFAVSAAAWLLDSWKPGVSQWFTVVALLAIILLGHNWLRVPGFLTLLAIPPALAAALINISAATATATGETVLLLLLPEYVVSDTDRATLLVALSAIWVMLGVVYALNRSTHQLSVWVWEYFRHAQSALEEARDRRAKLEQALNDLAHANRQLMRLNILAQGLRQEAEDARRAKEQFVAMVSHELRTPLNMIIGFSEMILQAPEIYGRGIPPSLLADLDVVLRNSQHLSRLIDDVLDLSQIEAEQMALTKERVSFQAIVEAATIAVRPLFDSKGLYLRTEISDDLPTVFCDPTRIRQVVLNLLSNAGRFTQRGGVFLQAWREGPFIIASVADTGSGIAAEATDKLFQPFQQLDDSLRRRYGGSGLGLSISKSFIELHGGKIWFKSEEGTGTTFFFRLPIDPPLPLDSGASRWFSPYLQYEEHARPSTAPAPLIRPRFVVLETGNALQRLLTRYLDDAEIVCVTSPQEAIRELTQTPVQALLVNDVASDDVLRSFDGSNALPYNTPVIACYVPGIHDSAGALGVSDYLVKPVSRDRLLAALDKLEGQGKTVLLVDDEPEALRLFRRMLASSGRGYRTLRATDGREAMKMLYERRPDAVLLDLIMPHMDGFQFLAEKSQDHSVRDVPVVVISARDPMGQPIVSNTLAVTQKGGLSVPQLLACIQAISRILSPARQAGDPVPTRKPFD